MRFPTFSVQLFGREEERRLLREEVDRVCRGHAGLICLYGREGVGKSALAEDLREAVRSAGGLLAIGACESRRRTEPLLAPRRAMRALAKDLLDAPDGVAFRLRKVLGGLAAVALELVPELEDILGAQPLPPHIGPIEAQNRVLSAMERILRGVAAVDHPLVLVLDDLHHGDAATLRLVEHLLQDPTVGLLLVAVYRDDLLTPEHPLTSTLDQPADDACRLTRLPVPPLPAEAVQPWLRHMLRMNSESALRLTEKLTETGEGSPLLIRRTLLLLVEEGVLQPAHDGWAYEEERFEDLAIPADAVGLIQAWIRRLSPPLRQVLQAASCCGDESRFGDLCAALEISRDELIRRVDQLYEEELLVRSSNGCRFVHERIRRACAQDLSEEQEREFHQRIALSRRGRLAGLSHEELFEVADHLRWCIESPTEARWLVSIARTHLRAGLQALRSASYEAAREYFETGIHALQRLSVEEHRPHQALDLDLRIEHARCVSFGGGYEAARELFEALSNNKTRYRLSPLQSGRVMTAQIETASIAEKYEESLRLGLGALRRLGMRLPKNPTPMHILPMMIRVRAAFRGDMTERIARLPVCKDPLEVLKMELLMQVTEASFFVRGRLFPLAVCRHGLEVLRNGWAPHAGQALVSVGVLLRGLFGDAPQAARLAQAALDLAPDALPEAGAVGEREDLFRLTRTTRGSLVMLSYAFVFSWVRPHRECLREIAEAVELGREEGDARIVGHTLSNIACLKAALGEPLGGVRRDSQQAERWFASASMPAASTGQACLTRYCSILTGRERVPESSDPLGVAELEDPLFQAMATVWSMRLLLLTGAADDAFELAAGLTPEAEQAVFSLPYFMELIFYQALAAADGEVYDARRRRTVRRAVRRFRSWTRHNPTFEPCSLILQAVVAEQDDDVAATLDLYERARIAAREYDLPSHEATILERLANLAAGQGWDRMAETSLHEAVGLYTEQEARFKAALLLRRHPAASNSTRHRSLAPARSSSVRSGSESEDVQSFLSDAQAILRERNLEGLIEQLMEAALGRAGAQRCVLILGGATPRVVAERTSDGFVRRDRPGRLLEECTEDMAIGVVRMAWRTGEAIFIEDAARDPRFAADPYLRSPTIRSLAAVPMLLQDENVPGMIYLEHSYISHVFSVERVDLLRFLASQAAVSLENIRLYDDLRDTHYRIQKEIQEQKRLDEMRRQLVAQLDSSQAEMERFTYTASHDLKNPLVTIRGFLGALRQDLADGRNDRLEKNMQVIEGATEKMYELLDELLELSRLGHEEPALELVALGELIEQALRSLTEEIEERGVRLEILEDLPSVQVDRRRFVEALEGLLENAIHFLGEQPAPRVEIRAAVEDKAIRLSIADNGIGIEAAYHEKIFDLFHRLDASSPNTGVGLALVRRIVEGHGGRVWVESEGLGHGSCFFISLPRPVIS